MGQSVVQVETLSKSFGSVVAVDRVSFTVGAKELFFLLGPSGCGKTTLLRMLAGLETPDGGAIRFDGAEVTRTPPHQRNAPMVFQNYALFPHLTVRDNVAFGLVERRLKREAIDARVAEALAGVELAGLEARFPGQLSGGQQQRVVLARALVLRPKIILLDEPLSNLDAKLRQEMRDEILRLHRATEITFVYVTHDQAEALSLADRMGVMHDGRLAAIGRPADLYHRPPSRFVADFLGEANLLPGVVRSAAGGTVAVATALGDWTATPAVPEAAREGARVLCLVRPENLTPGGEGAGRNRFLAQTADLRLNGSTVSVSLQAKGLPFRAALLNRSGLTVQPGGEGEWSARAEDTVALPEA